MSSIFWPIMPSLTKVQFQRNGKQFPARFADLRNHSIYERFVSELQFTYASSYGAVVYHSPRPRYDQDFIDSAYASYYQFSETIKLDNNAEVLHSSVSMFREEVANLLKYDKKRTNVLDIGSAMGTFLYAAKPFYKKAIGLDVSAQMAQYVEKNVGVTGLPCNGTMSFRTMKKFSLIHMSHVIEHIPNPVEWVQKAASMLEEDGVLVINVPNKFSLSFRLQHFYYKLGLKKQFSSTLVDPARIPDHLYEPQRKSMLIDFLEANHFEVLDYFTYSRKDPVSKNSIFSRLSNRFLHLGSNLSFIVRPLKKG